MAIEQPQDGGAHNDSATVTSAQDRLRKFLDTIDLQSPDLGDAVLAATPMVEMVIADAERYQERLVRTYTPRVRLAAGVTAALTALAVPIVMLVHGVDIRLAIAGATAVLAAFILVRPLTDAGTRKDAATRLTAAWVLVTGGVFLLFSVLWVWGMLMSALCCIAVPLLLWSTLPRATGRYVGG